VKLRSIKVLIVLACLTIWTTSFAQEPASAKPPVESAAGKLQVLKTVLCQEVKDREPQQEVSAAKVGDVVVGWMQVQSQEDTTLTHRWIHDGQTISDVSLNIKTSESFRAWSRKTIGSPGSWKWQVLDSSGKVLKEVSFTAAS
jgi:hypothetical protein